MSKRQIIIVFGALIIIIALFSGLPNFWNKTLYILVGLAIIFVAYATKGGAVKNYENTADGPFVDTNVDMKVDTNIADKKNVDIKTDSVKELPIENTKTNA